MNKKSLFCLTFILTVCALGFSGGVDFVRAQEKPQPSASVKPSTDDQIDDTRLDDPAEHHRYYGKQTGLWLSAAQRVAKVDVDGDMNYDGVISNTDPADSGVFESSPPGLVVGVGELTKIITRIRPYRINADVETVITLEVAGINRADRSGRFSSVEEEIASTGRIRVWKDSEKSELLLDSADPNLRYHEWIADQTVEPFNLPKIYPRLVYVEGVSPSPNYSGDLRLLLTATSRDPGEEREAPDPARRMSRFGLPAFDHLLLTVRPQPQEKEFINNNAEGVWMGKGN